MGTIFVPTGLVSRSSVLWADWDEASEDTLLVDQDGDGVEDTFICFMENTVAGGDEYGRGVVAGDDRKLTQAGNVAGATGTPPSRALNGTNQHFSATQVLADSTLATDVWAVAFKLGAMGNLSDGNEKFLLEMISAGAAEYLQIAITGTGRLKILVKDVDGAVEDAITTDSLSAGTEYRIMAWADGINKARAGFVTTKPTKWSDFAANNRVELANRKGSFTGVNFETKRSLFTANPANADQHVDCDAFYTLISQVCLIDNAA